MKLLHHIRDHLHRLRAQPAEELTRAQRSIKFGYDLARHCGRELREDRASQVAAALTYHTLFGMLPMLVLMLFMVAAFAGEERREQLKEDAITFLLDWAYDEDTGEPKVKAEPGDKQPAVEAIEAVAPAGAAMVEAGVDPGEASPDPAVIAKQRAEEYNRACADLRKNVTDLVNELEGVNFRSISIVGVLIFIWAATGLLTTIERSFNSIYDVIKSRPWYMRLPLYYTVITLGPLFLLAGLWLQSKLFELLYQINLPGADTSAWLNWAVGIGGVLSPVLTAWVVLSLMYVLLPNTKVSVRSATTGGVVAAVVWVVTIQLFAIYVQKAGIANLYGAIALVPLFLLWLWLTWFVVLFGLELTYTLQMMRGRHFERQAKRREQRIVYDPRWLLPVMRELGKAFDHGKPVAAEKLAQSVELPTPAVRELAELLRQKGLVHRVDEGKSGRKYTLAQPASQVKLADLLDIGSQAMTGRLDTGVLERIDKAQGEAVADMTLADIMRG